jgi:hypothetical protein
MQVALACALFGDTLVRAYTQGDAMNPDGQWKTEQYHGHDMHVMAQRRAHENPDLPGHGDQWDFVLKVTAGGAGPDSPNAETVRSDTGIFYSTQAIAENMGFLKGREIIEGRAGTDATPGQTL